ncbi:GPI mannosyltransferase 1 isoform X1 [Leptinotarsa decemlineata]|uniref:GPI mannosyltransferase 1 isoform X1 n=1 Tax=Leptinotarsa decemlineata TaxID=7539 RepID=UPI003D30A3DD
MFPLFKRIVCISYKKHLLISLIIRLILISYGIHHDQISEVKYTDIDYKVFTDASRHIVNGNSPYDRHTFRYSPFIAIFLIPNLTIHHSFGKVIFSLVDIIVGLLIRIIVKYNLKEYDCYKLRYFKRLSIRDESQLTETNQKFDRKMKEKMKKSRKQGMNIMGTDILSADDVNVNANIAMIFWLYNPLTIAIGTRGNCDSIAGFLVLLSLYFLQCRQYPFFAGLIHGVSIHFRLYPIMYSLTFFMFLSEYSFYSIEDRKEKCSIENISGKQLKNVESIPTSFSTNNEIVADGGNTVNRKTIFRKEYLHYLVPNSDQLKLIFGCISSLSILTWFFYQLFGYKFVFETYVYHLVRKDTRHNFSLFFYLQYLTAWVKNIGIWQKVLTVLPQIILILVFFSSIWIE